MIKRNTTKGKYVRICPKCGSIDVHTDFSNPVVWAYGTTTKYKCNMCSYTSNLFPEILQKDMKKYRNKIKQETKEGKVKYNKEDFIDTSTGFTIGLWEVTLLLISLLIVILFYVNS